MIVKMGKPGRSFEGLGTYLTHDPKLQTDERVAFVKTFNCAQDLPLSVIDEMYQTAQDAEFLKAEAGIRRGGPVVEKPVRHVSLNWHQSEQPTREHMEETAAAFLKSMEWQEHQALLVAHSDTNHPHVHLMINAIHPETGAKLNDRFDYRRAQQWAHEYEYEQGRVFCTQRDLPPEQRIASPPRPVHLALKESEREFERQEAARAEYDAHYLKSQTNAPIIANEEWFLLKGQQRSDRLSYMADGRDAFRELRDDIYQSVMEEFREPWALYHAARKEGIDALTLGEMKSDIVTSQKELLDAWRSEACAELRQQRDGVYEELLKTQQQERDDLTWRQVTGVRSPALLQKEHERQASFVPELSASAPVQNAAPIEQQFRSAAAETTSGRAIYSPEAVEARPGAAESADTGTRLRDPLDALAALGGGLLSISTLSEGLMDGFFGDAPKAPVARGKAVTATPIAANENPFQKHAEAARQHVVEEETRRASNEWWEERERARD